jgi:ketosteroid isomerase-like protein
MTRPGNPATLAADTVLAANQAFYDAFNARDADAMALLWSREHAVACIHPGWAPLSGRAAVLDAWRAILANPNTPSIACDGAEAMLWGDVALVLCFERLGEAVLAASNLFRLEEGVWRMVHHQAGPAAEGPESAQAPTGPRGRLH